MNTDNYDFIKSSMAQGEESYSPYVDKQTNNYINDLNGGIYSLNQNLVSFDLGSIYNSSRFTNTDDMFLTIPVTMVFNLSSGNGATNYQPPTAGWALQTLKSNFMNLIHQADIQVDGKTIAETQPFINCLTNVRMLSEMSIGDLKCIGSTLGFSDVLDSTNSVIWNAASATVNGQGLTNNTIFGNPNQITCAANQNTGCCNEAILKRASKLVDVTKTGLQNIWGTIITQSQLNSDFKPYYAIGNTNYGIVYDLAVIRLKDLFDCMSNIGLVRRFSGTLRIYVNTGALYLGCAANLVIPAYTFLPANSTFNNTCPFTINNLAATAANGGLSTGATQISAGLFIGKALTTSQNGVNLGLSGASHPLTSCRLYFSSITMNPQKALEYTQSNRQKKVVYRSYYFNQINNVSAGSSYSALLQSGIVNPYALIMIPYISSQQAGIGCYQWQSPFDTAPATGAPIILQNLQVQMGSVNILSNPYYYGFEDYITQFTTAEALTSSDIGVSNGLITKEWWEMNRMYYVNLSRGTPADKATPRNITVSFNNNSAVAIDILCFCVFLDDLTIDVETGLVQH